MIERLESRAFYAAVPVGFVDTVFTSGISDATAMEFAPDGRIFVAEQTGALRVVKNGQLLPTPFVTIDVDATGERGLLGVAFDPDFGTNHFVYLYHTVAAPDLHNRISRFTADGDIAVPGSEVDIFDVDPLGIFANHNGGGIHFGPDGKLYVGVGENAVPSNAQSLNTTLGKLLRINADGSIPSDNPFFDQTSGNNRAIWALGLRNPYTFAFERGSGRLFINDVGAAAFEEIDDGIAGSNYGWPATEGPTSDPQFRAPLFAYEHGLNNSMGVAITGGAFYDPITRAFPSSFAGTYFFADLGIGFIRNFNPASGAVTDFGTDYDLPVDMKVDANGDLFVLTRGDSSVHRISAASETLPVPTLLLPRTNRLFAAGAPIIFGAVASDPQDGRLGRSAFSWEVQLWEDGQQQSVVKSLTGRNIGAYRVPRVFPSASTDVFYRIVLSVTDSDGQTARTSRDVLPLLGSFTLSYNVPGLLLRFDGQTVAAPFHFTGVVGSLHVVEAITPQGFGGTTYIIRRAFPRRFVAVDARPVTYVGRFFALP